MPILGIYLVITLDGDIIAETTSVEMKIESVILDATAQEHGLNSRFIQGNIKVGLAGGFLLAASATDWQRLFDLMNAGASIDVIIYHNARDLISGPGVIRKLDSAGGISDSLCTGKYGIRVYVQNIGEGVEIITEGGDIIITEDGETIITD